MYIMLVLIYPLVFDHIFSILDVSPDNVEQLNHKDLIMWDLIIKETG